MQGHLVIIGGAEQRDVGSPVLRRFVELASEVDGPLMVLTAATQDPQKSWEKYRDGFRDLGARDVRHLEVFDRQQANDPALCGKVRGAAGIFMTGGDQAKLLAIAGGTVLCDEMRRAYVERGACIAGTSAGASAMSEHMLSSAESHRSPIDTHVELVAGLGFLTPALIDQHFSERGRLSRLLAGVAHNPKLIGVGIDENTALVVARGGGLEVIGEGAVTLVDGREMRTGVVSRGEDQQVFQATDVQLHLLPAGAGVIDAKGDRIDGEMSVSLREVVNLLVSPDAVDRQWRQTKEQACA
jgi:cyanophycinase